MQELLKDIDLDRMAKQYHAVYDGKTPEERLIIRQMTDAWCETLHLQNLRNTLLRKIGTDENTTMRSVALVCASYAEHALEHWKILAVLLTTTMEGVAEAMEREGARLRKIGWIAPQRPCWKDYCSLVDLVKAR